MLLPRPSSIRTEQGTFLLQDSTAITAPEELLPTAFWLQAALRPATGFQLPIVPAVELETAEPGIVLALSDGLEAESFRLTTGPAGVQIRGGGPAGVFYGCQALLQLLPPSVFRRSRAAGTEWELPAVTVADTPRFSWRGVMVDVARHFLPKHDLLRLIDLFAMHRLNTLHLHLTDDQGWRIEIKRYPKLTKVGSWRSESQVGATEDSPGDGRPHGGYYTQEDIAEIVSYAAERHIAVVPEIDLPGHSQAAIAAYPELGVTADKLDVYTRWGINSNVLNTEDSTVEFFRNVLDEVMDLFPGQIIGIGGDECPKVQWENDPRTQDLMRERGLENQSQLQAWFVRQLAGHLAARGRRAFAWDDVLEDEVPDGVVVASWRGMAGASAAAVRGFDVVSCPDDLVYLDYRQSELPEEPIPVAVPLTLQNAYSFEPVPDGLSADQAARVLGGQANIWTEHMDSPRTIDYFAFPRLCAVGETLWSTGDRDFDEFQDRLAKHLPRLDALGVEYRRGSGPMPWQARPGIKGRPANRTEWASFIDGLVAHIKDT